MAYYHVYPVNDLEEHTLKGRKCKCKPRVEKLENGHFSIVHNSFDGREKNEK